MTSDPRLEAFLTDSGEVFSGVQQGQNLWKPDPFDVKSINASARSAFEKLLNRAVGSPPPDSGKLLLLLGDSGSGKTHLVRAFRNLAHGEGKGYVGYMPMTVNTPHYDRYVLSHFIDSIDRSYDGAEGESGLRRLSSAVMSLCNSAFAPLIPDLEEDELPGMVSTVAYELQEADPRLREVNIDLLRALISLQRPDVRLHHAVLQWLRCKDLSAADRQLLDFVPRLEAGDSRWMLEQLGRLMGVFNQAMVLCVDQVEDISDFRQRPDMEAPFRQAVHILTHLAGNIPSAIVVICCLSDFWYAQKQKLTQAMLDRIEHDPEPVKLDQFLTAPMAREVAALRLKYLYAQHDVTVDATDPTWPFPAQGFEALNGLRTRAVLRHCRRYREQAIQSQRLPDTFPIPDPEAGQVERTPESKPLPFSLKEMEQVWTNFHAAFDEESPEEQEELAELLAWAIEMANGEQAGEARFVLQKQDEPSMMDVTLQPEGRRLRVAVCNHSARGGHLGRQMTEALQGVSGQEPVLVRTTDFPKTASTVTEQLTLLKKKGGRIAVLADGDLRELVALRMFWRAHTQPVLREWSQTSQPITRLRLVRDLLGLGESSAPPVAAQSTPAAKPSARPAAAQSTPPPTKGTAAPAAKQAPRQTVLELVPKTPEPKPDTQPLEPPIPIKRGHALKEAASGPLRVGVQEGLYSEPVTLEPDELTRHSAFLGGTGSGKTTLALNVVEQLLLRGIPAILVDRKGDLAGYAREAAWQTPLQDEALAERRRLLRERVDVALYTPGRSRWPSPRHPRGAPGHGAPVRRGAGPVHPAGRGRHRGHARVQEQHPGPGRAHPAGPGAPAPGAAPARTGHHPRCRPAVRPVRGPRARAGGRGPGPQGLPEALAGPGHAALQHPHPAVHHGRADGPHGSCSAGDSAVPGRTRLSIISTKFLGSHSSSSSGSPNCSWRPIAGRARTPPPSSRRCCSSTRRTCTCPRWAYPPPSSPWRTCSGARARPASA